MAVGSSSQIREAKLLAEPSWGVAESRIRVSDLVARFLASRARRDEPESPLRTATLWHSSMTMMSQRDLSR